MQMKCMPDVSLDALLAGTAFQVLPDNTVVGASKAGEVSKPVLKPAQRPSTKPAQHQNSKPYQGGQSVLPNGQPAHNNSPPSHKWLGSPAQCLSPAQKLLRAAQLLRSPQDAPAPSSASPSPHRAAGALPKPAAQQRRDAQEMLLPIRTQLAMHCASDVSDGTSQAFRAAAFHPEPPISASAHLARSLHTTQEAFQLAIDDVYDAQRLRLEGGQGVGRPGAAPHHYHHTTTVPLSPSNAAGVGGQQQPLSPHRQPGSHLPQPPCPSLLVTNTTTAPAARHDSPARPHTNPCERTTSTFYTATSGWTRAGSPAHSPGASMRPASAAQGGVARQPSTAWGHPASTGLDPTRAAAGMSSPARLHVAKVTPTQPGSAHHQLLQGPRDNDLGQPTRSGMRAGNSRAPGVGGITGSCPGTARKAQQTLPGSLPSFEQVHVLLSSIQMPVSRSAQPSPSHMMAMPPQLLSPKAQAYPPYRSAVTTPTKASTQCAPPTGPARQSQHTVICVPATYSPDRNHLMKPASPATLHTPRCAPPTSTMRAEPARQVEADGPQAGLDAGVPAKHGGGLVRSPGQAGKSWPRILDPESGAALPAPHTHVMPAAVLTASAPLCAGSLRVGVELGGSASTELLVMQATREQAVRAHLDLQQACWVLELDGVTSCTSGHDHQAPAVPASHHLAGVSRSEEPCLPQSLLVLTPRLLRLKAVVAVAREQGQAMAAQLLRLHTQLQAALKELHLTRALEVGTKLGMSKQQLRRLRAVAPEAGGAAFNLTLLRGVVQGHRLRLAFSVLQQQVTRQQQTELLVQHAGGVMFQGQLSVYLAAWLHVVKQRGVVRRAIVQHRQARLYRNLHLAVAFWHVWTQYQLGLQATLVAARQAAHRRTTRRCFTWWHTYTCYCTSLTRATQQLYTWGLRRVLRGWRGVMMQQTAQRHKSLVALASHVRCMMTSALAHWRCFYLQSYMDRVWIRAVDSWRAIRLKGRVLAQWHFLARRAAQVIARAAHPGRAWQGAALQASPPLGLHGMWTAAHQVLSTAAFLIEAAGDEVRHLRRFYRFHTAPPPQPASDDLDVSLAAGLPAARPGGLLTALLDAAARAAPAEASVPETAGCQSGRQHDVKPAVVSPDRCVVTPRQQREEDSTGASATGQLLPSQHLLLNQWQYKHEVNYLLHELHQVTDHKRKCEEAIRNEKAKAEDLDKTLKERESSLLKQLAAEHMAADIRAVQDLERLTKDVQVLSAGVQQAAHDVQAASVMVQAAVQERMRPQVEAAAAHAAATAALGAARVRLSQAEEAVSIAESREFQGREVLARCQQRLSEALHINAELAHTVREVARLADQAPSYQAPRHLNALDEARMQLCEAQHVVMLVQSEVTSRESEANDLARAVVCAQVEVAAARQALQDAEQEAQQAARVANAASEAMEKRESDAQTLLLKQLQEEEAQVKAGAHAARLKLASAQQQLAAAQVHCTPGVIQAVNTFREVQSRLQQDLAQVHTDQQSLDTLLSSRLLPLTESLAESAAVEVQLQQRLTSYPAALVDELNRRWGAPHDGGGQQHQAGDECGGPSRLTTAWMLGRDALHEAQEEVEEPVLGGPPGSPRPWHFNPMGFQHLPLHMLHPSRAALAQHPSGRGRAARSRSPPTGRQNGMHGGWQDRRSRSCSPMKLHSDASLRATLLGRICKVAGRQAGGSPGRVQHGDAGWVGELRDWGKESGVWYPPGIADRPPSPRRPGYVSPRAVSPTHVRPQPWSIPARHDSGHRAQRQAVGLRELSLSAAARRLLPLDCAVARAGLPRLTLSDWSSECQSQMQDQVPDDARVPGVRVPASHAPAAVKGARTGGDRGAGRGIFQQLGAAGQGSGGRRVQPPAHSSSPVRSDESEGQGSASTASLLRSFLNAHPPLSQRSPGRLNAGVGVARRLRPYAAVLAAHPIKIHRPGSSPARQRSPTGHLNVHAPTTEAGNPNQAYPGIPHASSYLNLSAPQAEEQGGNDATRAGDVVGAGNSSSSASLAEQPTVSSVGVEGLGTGWAELAAALEQQSAEQAAPGSGLSSGRPAAAAVVPTAEAVAQQPSQCSRRPDSTCMSTAAARGVPPAYLTHMSPSGWHYVQALAPDLAVTGTSGPHRTLARDDSCTELDSSAGGSSMAPESCQWCAKAGVRGDSPGGDTHTLCRDSAGGGLPRLSRMEAGAVVFRAGVVMSKVIQGLQSQVAVATVRAHEAFHRGHRCVQHWVLRTWHQHATTLHSQLQLLRHVAVCGHCWRRWRGWAARRAQIWRLLTAHTQHTCLTLMHKALMCLRAAVQHKVFRASCIQSCRQAAARRALHYWCGKAAARRLVGRVFALADGLWEARDSNLLYGLQFQMMQHMFDRWVDFTCYKRVKRHDRALQAAAAAHHTTRLLVRCMRHWQVAVSQEQEQQQLRRACGQLLQEWRRIARDAACDTHGRHVIRQHLRRHGFSCELAVWRHLLLTCCFTIWGKPWVQARGHCRIKRLAAVWSRWREEVTRSKCSQSHAVTLHHSALLVKAFTAWQKWLQSRITARVANATAVMHRVCVLRRHAMAGLRVRHLFEVDEHEEGGRQQQQPAASPPQLAPSCQACDESCEVNVTGPTAAAPGLTPESGQAPATRGGVSVAGSPLAVAAGSQPQSGTPARRQVHEEPSFYEVLLQQAEQQAHLVSQQIASLAGSPGTRASTQQQGPGGAASVVLSLTDLSTAQSQLLGSAAPHTSGWQPAAGGSRTSVQSGRAAQADVWDDTGRTDVAVASCVDLGSLGAVPAEVREAAVLELCMEWRRLWVMRGVLWEWHHTATLGRMVALCGGVPVTSSSASSGGRAAGRAGQGAASGGKLAAGTTTSAPRAAAHGTARRVASQPWVRPAPVISLPHRSHQPRSAAGVMGLAGRMQAGAARPAASRKPAQVSGKKARAPARDGDVQRTCAAACAPTTGHQGIDLPNEACLQTLLLNAAARTQPPSVPKTGWVGVTGVAIQPTSILAGATGAAACLAPSAGAAAGKCRGLATGLWGSPISSVADLAEYRDAAPIATGSQSDSNHARQDAAMSQVAPGAWHQQLHSLPMNAVRQQA